MIYKMKDRKNILLDVGKFPVHFNRHNFNLYRVAELSGTLLLHFGEARCLSMWIMLEHNYINKELDIESMISAPSEKVVTLI